MTKSELIEALSLKQTHLFQADVELSVNVILDRIAAALEKQERVELRGFGSFAMNQRPARIGRNPKTGATVDIPPKRVPHFKPGKEMRERVNQFPIPGIASIDARQMGDHYGKENGAAIDFVREA